MNDSNQKRFLELRDAALDGRATQEEIRELESIAMASPERLREFAEAAAIHGELCLLGTEAREQQPTATPVTRETKGSRTWRSITWAMALAASVLVATALWNRNANPADSNETFAVLETTVECLWQTSTVPLAEGQRLGVGHLRLASGFASLRFDNETQLDLEGPADLQILDPMHCRLASGTAVVTVRDGLRGFVVDTPTGRLTDQGTSFGVSVKSDGASVVEVFDGRVDLEVRETGETRSLTQQTSAWLLSQQILSPNEYRLPSTNDARRLTQIFTSQGDGGDVWIQRDPKNRKGPEDLLLVKKSDELIEFDRQIRLRFDFRGLADQPIERAALQLTAVPSGIGFASRTPDSTFSVYGRSLPNEAPPLSPNTVPWLDLETETSDWSLVDRFVIPKGSQSESHTIESASLNDLVNQHRSDIIELAIVRDTPETMGGGLVHAFASSRHESIPGPTLRVWQ